MSDSDAAFAAELAASRARTAELELRASIRAANSASLAAAAALAASAPPVPDPEGLSENLHISSDALSESLSAAPPAPAVASLAPAAGLESPVGASAAAVTPLAAAAPPAPAAALAPASAAATESLLETNLSFSSVLPVLPVLSSVTAPASRAPVVIAASDRVEVSSRAGSSPGTSPGISPPPSSATASAVFSSPVSAANSVSGSSEEMIAADLHSFSFADTAASDNTGTAGIAAMVMQLQEQGRAETVEMVRQLTAEFSAQRESDRELAIEAQASLRQLIESSRPAPAAAPPAPALAPAVSERPADRRATTFSSVVGSGADAQVTQVSAVLPRSLTDPDLASLPTFNGDDGTVNAFRRAFLQAVAYVAEESKCIILRGQLRDALRDRVEADLESNGVGPSTAVDIDTLWGLIVHHSSSPSDAAASIARAAVLTQSSPSQFTAYSAKLTQHWLDAGIYMGREAITEDEWTTVRIGLLSVGLHPSVMRELLRDPGVFTGTYDDFRRACSDISASLSHQAGRRGGGVAMVDGSAPAADSDEYQGWVASMQGGGTGLPRDEVFKFPWDNVAAWCARFPPRAGSPAGCAFCAKSKDATCRATASKHVAPMCANMHHRNVRQPMTSATAQRVVSELRAAGYPVPQ